MSSTLRGRYIIDRVKRWALNAFNVSLPVPPYESPEFWERSYKTFSALDPPHEWANLDHAALDTYDYRWLVGPQRYSKNTPMETTFDTSHQEKPLHGTTLVETLGLQPITKSENDTRRSPRYNDVDDQPLVMLGCGNSRMALDMWHSGQYKGPVIQVDVSSRIVEIMSTWCAKEMEQGDMFVVQDDATELSSLSMDHSVAAALDKGLIDALFCASDGTASTKIESCWKVLQSVHRVLQPRGYFCFYSYSQPSFVLSALQQPQWGLWREVQVRHDVANGILLYRFQKADSGGGDARQARSTSKGSTNRNSRRRR